MEFARCATSTSAGEARERRAVLIGPYVDKQDGVYQKLGNIRTKQEDNPLSLSLRDKVDRIENNVCGQLQWEAADGAPSSNLRERIQQVEIMMNNISRRWTAEDRTQNWHGLHKKIDEIETTLGDVSRKLDRSFSDTLLRALKELACLCCSALEWLFGFIQSESIAVLIVVVVITYSVGEFVNLTLDTWANKACVH
ncbi:hypothetical protein K474DRAFT_1714347 [Panus rudis PR-1116 ss-1]|nr:hypothetical protein K474DRAFT_1714347 [Panus rudis PR-1116 ss-1]